MIEFKLPSLGADMDEGKLLEWRVKPGDVVKKGDVVAVVDTSKAAIDVECWDEGIVHALLVEPEQTVPVGTPLAILLAPGESAEGVEIPRREAAPAAPAAGAPAAAAPPAAAAATRKPVSPAARRRAQELGVDVDGIAGSGPQGAVTVEDVERAAEAPAATPAEAAEPAAPADRYAEMRRTIAAAMARSKREIPHYYLSEDIPLEKAQAWLDAQNAQRPLTGRILMAALFVRAVARAAKRYPEVNGFWRDGGFQPAEAVHAGIAISLRQGGLIAPGILDADSKSVEELMRDLADLVKRTRAGSLKSREVSEQTLTITNLGDTGVQSVHGVIYPPQVALVGFGRVMMRAWAVDGEVKVVPVVSATLAADHRVSDGHRGGLFLAAVRDLLQEPEGL